MCDAGALRCRLLVAKPPLLGLSFYVLVGILAGALAGGALLAALCFPRRSRCRPVAIIAAVAGTPIPLQGPPLPSPGRFCHRRRWVTVIAAAAAAAAAKLRISGPQECLGDKFPFYITCIQNGYIELAVEADNLGHILKENPPDEIWDIKKEDRLFLMLVAHQESCIDGVHNSRICCTSYIGFFWGVEH